MVTSPLWSEGPLGVDVEALPLGPAVVDGELAGDGQSVTQLRLPRPDQTDHHRAIETLIYLNSPNSSVMLPVSMPPFKSLSSSFDPVVTWMI